LIFQEIHADSVQGMRKQDWKYGLQIYTHFTDASYAISYASLVMMLIHCGCKSTIAKRIT